jgi:NADH-quinone oxidoreductase subunit N
MLEQITSSLNLFLPETVLTITFCVLILASFIRKTQRPVSGFLAIAGLLVTAYILYRQVGIESKTIFFGMIALDSFSLFFRSLILLTTFLVVIFSLQSQELKKGSQNVGEYYALLMALTLGLFLMTGASHMLMMYLGLELSSISAYLLTGYTKEAEDSSEASLKYIIYGSFSSGTMLFGISILYGLTGTFDIYKISSALMIREVNVIALLISGILIMVGFGYKISAVPFHFWTPDVYQGAPITITAFLSVASKAAGFAMLIRFFSVAFYDPAVDNLGSGVRAAISGFDWNLILAVLSVLSMTIGNFVALWQNNLKRLLAYSSIAHAGYMLMGVVVLSNNGISAVLIYFVVYLFMNLGAFYSVMIIAEKTGSEDIESYKGLGYRAPFVGVAFTIFLLSLTGIPPTAGFIGKLYIFASLIDAHWFWLAIVGVLNSVVSLYYYARIIRNMFLRTPEGNTGPLHVSFAQVIVILIILIPTLLLGLYFSPLVEIAQASVSIFGLR